MRKILGTTLLSLLIGVLPALAIAQSAAVSLMEKDYQGIRYLNGGIGEEERDEVLAREKDFSLKLLFAEKTGSYLVDVNVLIANAKGQTVLEVPSAGPFLLIKLPAGSYQVQVTSNEQMQKATVRINEKGHVARVFHW